MVKGAKEGEKTCARRDSWKYLYLLIFQICNGFFQRVNRSGMTLTVTVKYLAKPGLECHTGQEAGRLPTVTD